MDAQDLSAHLATLGLPVDGAPSADGGLALDATITPETFARATAPRAAGEGAASVGPLPHIALSGLGVATGASAGAGTGTRTGTETGAGAGADLQIVGLLGEGGMGRVHLARQRSLGRDVAVKTLKHDLADLRATEMLRAEATTMGRLEHPNVVPVHAVGHDDGGQLLLVMKRIDGISWRELLRDAEHPRWSSLADRIEDRLEVHLDVLVQVANALHFAHGRGVVHRDVKPENVLLGEHGEVYLADWGIAGRIGASGPVELVGTPTYMAPEMVVGDPARIDARTDVFLLGASLHEVLTGAPPHEGTTLQGVLLHALEAVAPRYDAQVPVELAAIATRAMSSRPEDRFPTALAFRQALDERRRHRGAVSLLGSARALLAELEPAIRHGRGDVEIDRRLTECRFALLQALREWPESADARALLETVLRLSIRHELDRDNATAARSLLGDLSGPDPALAEEIDALEARLASGRAETERLRELERDEDLRVGLRSRMASMGVLLALSIGISAYVAMRTPTSDMLSGELLLTLAGLVVLVSFAGIALFARHILRNAAGRRITGLLATFVLALFAHRAIGVALDVPPVSILALDLVLLAAMSAATGVIVPRTAWSALVPLAALPMVLLDPSSTPTVFATAALLDLVAVCVLWMWGLRAQEARARQAETSRRPPA